MGLLAPWFLAGTLAVGLPLWLHLMRRRNPVRLPFSSLMFFEKRTETTIRERRLRYLLLLACRLALLFLLALAFAKPVWERPPAVIAGSIPKLHFIVLDTSLSMRYGDRWERAMGEAQDIVDSLRQGD
ncbi:MAG: BatA domain-containing protein, partial [Bryobacterales bacterium]|nr:BatA domain-containing protein [Bryobacterales bacterium]